MSSKGAQYDQVASRQAVGGVLQPYQCCEMYGGEVRFGLAAEGNEYIGKDGQTHQ